MSSLVLFGAAFPTRPISFWGAVCPVEYVPGGTASGRLICACPKTTAMASRVRFCSSIEVRLWLLHLSCQWSRDSSSPPTKGIALKDSSRVSDEPSTGRASGGPAVAANPTPASCSTDDTGETPLSREDPGVKSSDFNSESREGCAAAAPGKCRGRGIVMGSLRACAEPRSVLSIQLGCIVSR